MGLRTTVRTFSTTTKPRLISGFGGLKRVVYNGVVASTRGVHGHTKLFTEAVPHKHPTRNISGLVGWRGAVYTKDLFFSLGRKHLHAGVLFAKKALRWLTTPLFLICFGVFLAIPKHPQVIYADPQPKPPAPPIHEIKDAVPLPATTLAPVATLATVYIPPPQPVVSCGSDPYMSVIYQKESGCNTAAINEGGCRGLGQACPGSKLPCSDYDWDCQNAWFTNYAVAVYGSIYNAYLYRISHNFW